MIMETQLEGYLQFYLKKNAVHWPLEMLNCLKYVK